MVPHITFLAHSVLLQQKYLTLKSSDHLPRSQPFFPSLVFHPRIALTQPHFLPTFSLEDTSSPKEQFASLFIFGSLLILSFLLNNTLFVQMNEALLGSWIAFAWASTQWSGLLRTYYKPGAKQWWHNGGKAGTRGMYCLEGYCPAIMDQHSS